MGCKSCCYGPTAAIIAALIGTGFCIIFSLTFHYFPNIFNDIVLLVLPMRPNGIIYPYWVNPPIDLNITLYAFDYINPDEFMQNWTNGVKLKVVERGPYTYSCKINKVFLDWSDSPYVSYRQIQTFHFHKEWSNGTEDDMITIPNPVLLVLMDMVDKLPKIAEIINQLMEPILEAEPPFINVSVGDFLAHGYYDPYLDVAQKIFGKEYMPGGYVGILYGRNATDDGKFTMDTGITNTDNLYQVEAWEGQTSLDKEWTDEYCGMINGSDGTLYPVGVGKLDRVYMFLPFILRALYFNYTNDHTFKGVNCYNFRVPLDYYADYNMNPDNKCYSNGTSVAWASGVQYMGKIAHGAPLYMSNPHFLDGDFTLVEQFDGLHPDNDKHSSNIGIIPEFGAPIQGNVKLQLSIPIVAPKNMNKISHWPTLMLPIVWGNGNGELTDEMAKNIKKYYYGGMKLVYALFIIAIVISGLVGLLGILCAYKLMFQFKSSTLRMNENQPFIMMEETTGIKNEIDPKVDYLDLIVVL